jgi:hypothetical protein
MATESTTIMMAKVTMRAITITSGVERVEVSSRRSWSVWLREGATENKERATNARGLFMSLVRW